VGFAQEVTPAEAALGFEVAKHIALGTIVFARLANGLRAIKMVGDSGAVRYEICDDAGIVLYAPAASVFELRNRFGLGDRRTADASQSASDRTALKDRARRTAC
jgi:hypothetical protein